MNRGKSMLDALKDVVRKSSIHVCLINTGGCNGCDIEVVALLSPRYDLEQYGIYVHNNPREADVLLITGAMSEQWKKNLQRIYAKAPEPKIVVAIGNCPLTGDVFNQEGCKIYAPVSDFIPVDAEIPGCPPRPSEILAAILAVGPDAIAAKGRQKP
jgi:energy-converting hydrogenase A subunit N